MPNMIPAGNVQIATIAGFLSVVLEHVFKANGIDLPPDISSAMPAVITIVAAHICDMVTNTKQKSSLDKENVPAA